MSLIGGKYCFVQSQTEWSEDVIRLLLRCTGMRGDRVISGLIGRVNKKSEITELALAMENNSA
jgi:hypothetical protein